MGINRKPMSLAPWIMMAMGAIVILIGIAAIAAPVWRTVSAPPPTVTATVRLTVLAQVSPTCPVMRPGQSGCAPRVLANATISLRSSSGMSLQTGDTGPDGIVVFLVAPGSYILHAEAGNTAGYGGLPRPPADQGILVPAAGAMATLDYDSGIR